jgi:putative ubiquitin-RnfH superfamily antitoxin RatB of RatAB toxin-antitoxin module
MEIRVTLVFSPSAREVREVVLALEPGTTVTQALQSSGLLEQFPQMTKDDLTLGVWGRKVAPHQVLQDLDRVEIYRPLKVDPKVARRTRFLEQGARSAGLFARKRPGAKAGY